ncbi:MAG: hypothetical protein K1060chlam4_00988 [Candidatus Anoxychlamydiales bacterium]|nr:hypothetical protein [Candidatus Anoxychlamydiales bacterium]
MADVKVQSNPLTKIDDNIFRFTQGGNDFLIITKPTDTEATDEKISYSKETPFENIKIICLGCLNANHSPQINHEYNPHIEVKPHIEVNSSDSMKKKAITLLAGAALGIITMKYGLGAASTLGSMIVNHLNLNISGGIQNLSSYLQNSNLSGNIKPSSTANNIPKATASLNTPPIKSSRNVYESRKGLNFRNGIKPKSPFN